MSMMPFAKQAVSKARKSIYDSLELEEVVVDIEYYSSDNEEEQRQRERRSPSIEDSKFGILAAATTLTSLRESRPAMQVFNAPSQVQEEPRRKFNIAHIALPLMNEPRAPLNIFVKHEVVADPISSSAFVPIKLFNDSPASVAGPSSAVQSIEAASSGASAKFVITNPPINLGPSSSTSNDHTYLLSDNAYGAFRFDTQGMAAVRPKSVSTSPSESSLPCEVSSTVAENSVVPESEQNGEASPDEVSHAFQGEASCSSSSAYDKVVQQMPKFKCSRCPKTFTALRGLQSHMKAHKRRFRFSAKANDIHDEDYDDSRDKDYQQRPQVASSSAIVTQTWTTDDVPAGSSAIKIEPPSHYPEEPKEFICADCNKRFSCQKGLKIHIKSHEKRALNNGQRQQLAGGQALEGANDEKDVEFHEFQKELEDADEDDERVADDLEGGAIVGGGSKPEGRMFLCTVCGKRFCRRNHLVFHLRIHSGERPYPCGICPARFSRADSLKVHMRIHTGERPYVCDICGAAFAQMINANVHRRCHTGEKPFECEECGARFIKKDGLTVHRRIHTGEKPYCCDQCGARFAYRSCILSHYKVHNGELLYRCEKCNAGFSLLCNLTRHKRVHAEEEEAAA